MLRKKCTGGNSEERGHTGDQEVGDVASLESGSEGGPGGGARPLCGAELRSTEGTGPGRGGTSFKSDITRGLILICSFHFFFRGHYLFK